MKPKVRKKEYNIKTKCFCALECLYLFFYAYRYILQYNSTTTSSTYSDTPVYLQALKYILVFAILAYYAIRNRMQLSIARRNIMLFLLLILLINHDVFFIIGYHSEGAAKFAIGLLPILFFLDDKTKIAVNPVTKIFELFFVFTTIYELIQIILYFAIGRLPALGYPTGKITDVRFGGAWDDPNGYAMLLTFYIPFFFVKYEGGKRVFLEVCCLIMELLCWSGTGWICTLISCSIVFLLRNNNEESKTRFLIFLFVFLVNGLILCILKRSDLSALFSYFFYSKQGSVKGHMAGWNVKGINIRTLLGLSITHQGGEIGYINIILCGGVIDLTVFVSMLMIILRRLAFMVKKGTYYCDALFCGSFGYTLAIILGSLNLPFFYNFSNMGILALMICLAADRITVEDTMKSMALS